jgi:hypothetical protein
MASRSLLCVKSIHERLSSAHGQFPRSCSALAELGVHAVAEYFDRWAFLGVGEIEADDLRGFCRRGVVKVEHRSAGRLEEAIARAQHPRLFAFRLDEWRWSPVGCPGANLMRAPCTRRTGGFAEGSASFNRGARLSGLKRASTTIISDLDAGETRPGRRFSANYIRGLGPSGLL